MPSFADDTFTQTITNSTQIIDQYLDSITNSTSQIILPIGNTTLSPDSQIEIGQTVKWTQVITLNDTTDSIAVEIPDDAEIQEITITDNTEQVNIIDENQINTDESIFILETSETEIILENSVNFTAVIDNQESLLVKLESTESTDAANTKLIVVSEDNVEQVQIEYETGAAYTIEDESDEPDHYEKTVTVKSDSTIHYENVRSYSDIPEEYVLLGIPFTLDWIINGTTVNVIDDSRFDVNFEDTNGNGLVDQMSWIVPQLSEKIFSINADTSGIDDDILDVSLKLEQMKVKFDGSFYDKTLEMVNANVMGKLDEYLIEDRNLNGTTVDVDSLEYYDVIILPNLNGWNNGDDIKETIKQNQQEIKQNLEVNHNARNVFTAEILSFISAQIPVIEISRLSEYGNVKIIGDGEINLQPALDKSKEVIRSTNIHTTQGILLNDNDITIAVIDTGIDHNLINENIKEKTYCDDDGCRDTSIPSISDSHGTMVAGIIASNGDTSYSSGIVPESNLLDIQKPDDFGLFQTTGLAKSLEWALQNGANIINISFTVIDDGDTYYIGKTFCTSETISLVVDEVVDEGINLIIASGNKGNYNINNNFYKSIEDPSCGFNALTVGNLNDNNSLDSSNHEIFFGFRNNNFGTRDVPENGASGKGPSNDGRLKPEIVAPGTDIDSITNELHSTLLDKSGTSFAAPHVTGAAAILLQASPQYTPLEIKSALMLGASWSNPNEINPTLPLTAKTYENATSNAIAGNPIPVEFTDHEKLNEWGFGLLDVQQSVTYATDYDPDSPIIQRHIISDSYGYSPITGQLTLTPRQYTFTSDGDDVKIILSWLNHPFVTGYSIEDPDEINSFFMSNFDLSVSGPGLTEDIISDSIVQNNEFIVFQPPSTGKIYTVTVTPKAPLALHSGAENYVISATEKLTPIQQNINHAPIAGAIKPTSILPNAQIPFTIVLTSYDADGDEVSFFVKNDPDNGLLSSIRRFNDLVFVDYMATSSGVADSFSVIPWDGRSLGNEIIITLDPSIPPTGSIILDDLSGTAEQEYTITFEDNGPQTKNGILPTSITETSLFDDNSMYQFFFGNILAEAQSLESAPITSIQASVTAVNGAVLEYTIDSVSYKQFIPPHSEKQIVFDSSKIIQDIKIHKHLSEGTTSSATIGYTFDDITEPPPTDNNSPIARITIPDNIVDEQSTVTLDGTTSSDQETSTNNLSYEWEIIGNSIIDPVFLSSTDTSTTSFIAPSYIIHPTQEFIQVRLTVTDDDTNQALSDSEIITITVNSTPNVTPPGENTAPVVHITSPVHNSDYTIGNTITLVGTAIDAQDGDLSNSIIWTSSIDGNLDTGSSVTFTPSAGAHYILAESIDSENLSQTTFIIFTVTDPNIAEGITITTPSQGETITDSTVVISGIASHPNRINDVHVELSPLSGKPLVDTNFQFVETWYYAFENVPDGTYDANAWYTYLGGGGTKHYADPVTITVDTSATPEDTTPPVITLIGDTTQTITIPEPYTELGAVATDDTDDDIASSIIIDSSSVDVNIIGPYLVYYDVSDSAGNDAVQVTRIVNVVDDISQDTTPPTITLNGDSPQIITLGETYSELGAIATDDDINYSGNVIIDSTLVDTSVPNSYTVSYTAADDPSGNAGPTITRTIHVVEDQSPVITLNGANTITIHVNESYTELGAILTDNDPNYSGIISIDSSSLDLTTGRVYSIIYTAPADASGNVPVPVTRTINVIDIEQLFGISTVDFTVPSGQSISVTQNTDYRNLTIEDGGILLVSDSVIRISGEYNQIGTGHIKVKQTGCVGGIGGTTQGGLGGAGGGFTVNPPAGFGGLPGESTISVAPTVKHVCNIDDLKESISDNLLNYNQFFLDFESLDGSFGSDGILASPSGSGGLGGPGYYYSFSGPDRFGTGKTGGDGGTGAQGVDGVNGGGKTAIFANNIVNQITINAKGNDGNNGNQGTSNPGESGSPTTEHSVSGNIYYVYESFPGTQASSAGTLGSAGSQGGIVYLTYGLIPDGTTPSINVLGGLGGYNGAYADATSPLLSARAETGPDGYLHVRNISLAQNSGTCLIPHTGDWIIENSCTITSDVIASANVLVQNNSILTVSNDTTLNIDLKNHHLKVESGSGALVKFGGVINLVGNDADSNDCMPPQTGDWIIENSCTITADVITPANISIQNNSILTIPDGVTLDVDLENYNILVKSDSAIIIRQGGTIK